MPPALERHITQLAVRHTVPGCWPCTLLRISLALRWRIALAALLLGLGVGLPLGALAMLAARGCE